MRQLLGGSTIESDVEARIKKALLIEKAKELGWNEEQIRQAFTLFDLEAFEAKLKKSAKISSDCPDGQHCQKIVSEKQLLSYLREGWKVRAILPSGKLVIAMKSKESAR